MKTIVIGSLNTDLIAVGIKKFPKPGEHVYGRELKIGPGGKSRNIADMIAHLSPANSVAIVGRTAQDPYGLWKLPIDALAKAGVNTDYVHVLEYAEAKKLPGIALIPVDEHGNNQIIVLPGVSDDFSRSDIDKAAPLFKQVGLGKGNLVLTLECPIKTAVYAARLAKKHGMKILFDPGGIEASTDITDLVKVGIYFIKPNEHEAKVLTGISVKDQASAQAAAEKLHAMGIPNVLITVGANGAYLSSESGYKHIPSPQLEDSNEKDETGCGDQTTAALCAFLQEGKALEEAAELAILAGTLQFHSSGIQPVAIEEITTATELLDTLKG